MRTPGWRGIITLLVSLAGCSLTPRDFRLELNGFPSDLARYDILVRSFEVRGDDLALLDEWTFDAVGCDEVVSTTVGVRDAARYLAAYLFIAGASGGPFYFSSFEIAEDADTASISYWLDYPAYFDDQEVLFGVSRQQYRPLSIGSSTSQDFMEAPYFLYRLTGLQGRSHTLSYQVVDGDIEVGLWLGESFEEVVGDSGTRCYPDVTYPFEACDFDEQTLLLKPSNYDGGCSSLLTTTDISQSIPGRFVFSDVELGADGNLYFLDWAGGDLLKWDRGASELTIAADYPTSDVPLTTMALSEDRQSLYLGAGNDVWTYHCMTGAIEKAWTAGGRVRALYTAASYLVAAIEAIPFDSFCTQTLLRLPDFTQTDALDDWVYPSRSFAFSPAANRIYLLQDDTGSPSLWYQDVDLVQGVFGTRFYRGYQENFGLGRPIRLSPDQTRLLSASGNIFTTDSTLTLSGSLGSSYADLLFYGDRIFLLKNTQVGYHQPITCTLQVLDADPPYTLLGTPVELGKKGRRLLLDGDSLIVVSQTTTETYEFDPVPRTVCVSSYPFSDLDAACGTPTNSCTGQLLGTAGRYAASLRLP